MILAKITYSFGDTKGSNPDTWTASIISETIDQAAQYIIKRFSNQRVFIMGVETVCDAIHSMTPEAAKTIAENYIRSMNPEITQQTAEIKVSKESGLNLEYTEEKAKKSPGRPPKKKLL